LQGDKKVAVDLKAQGRSSRHGTHAPRCATWEAAAITATNRNRTTKSAIAIIKRKTIR